MKRRQKPSSSQLLEAPPADEALQTQAEVEAARKRLVDADRDLAQRCVAGQVNAWEELHAQCNHQLVQIVCVLLSGRTSDINLAEEITARVWYALVADDGELLTRYDPGRGARLITFLRAIARDEVRRHFRSELRRRVREGKASRQRAPHYSTDDDQVDVSLNEFLETLSPSERQFCGEYLLDSPDDDSYLETDEMTRANFWQKTHRVYKRFVRFFGDGT